MMIRKLIRSTNGLFITGVLSVFYILFIGVSFLFFKLWDFVKKDSRQKSGWEDVERTAPDENFTSSY